MSDFFDRLDKYMAYKGLNDNKLTVNASLSIGALNKQRKGSRGLSSDSIAKILHACTDLNGHWLLTGQGVMLRADGDAPTEQPDPQPTGIKPSEEFLKEMLKEKDAEIGRLNQEIGGLKAEKKNHSEVDVLVRRNIGEVFDLSSNMPADQDMPVPPVTATTLINDNHDKPRKRNSRTESK